MKPKAGEQLALFETRVAKPPNRIAYCSKCGREIMVQRFTADGYISEYRSREGKCYGCTFNNQSRKPIPTGQD